jgi:hypothetical protein
MTTEGAGVCSKEYKQKHSYLNIMALESCAPIEEWLNYLQEASQKLKLPILTGSFEL